MCRTQTDGPNRYPHNRIITRFIMAFGFYRFRISVCPRCSAIPCSKFSEAASERMTVFNSPVTRSRLASSEREPSLSVTDSGLTRQRSVPAIPGRFRCPLAGQPARFPRSRGRNFSCRATAMSGRFPGGPSPRKWPPFVLPRFCCRFAF